MIKGRGYGCMETGNMWIYIEGICTSSQFSCEPKAALKKTPSVRKKKTAKTK